MKTSRLELFSDGVMAIIITIMVLELHIPKGAELESLLELLPKFLAYALSFAIVGIYWNNHHHLLHTASKINPKIMWHNLFLLFCLSLIPFFTGWLGEHYTHAWPVAFYGISLLGCAFAYNLLQSSIASIHPDLAKNIGADIKGKISLACYLAGVILAFFAPVISLALYTLVAIIWFSPDRRLNLPE